MNFIFDTTVLSKILSNDKAITRYISAQEYEKAVIPLATDAELRFGFMHGSRELENLNTYEEVKKLLNRIIHTPALETSKIYAQLATYARKNGVALSNNDIWIAATAIEQSGKLVTLDND